MKDIILKEPMASGKVSITMLERSESSLVNFFKHIIQYNLYIVGLLFFVTACNNNAASDNQMHISTPENMVSLTEAQYQNAGIETSTLETKLVSSTIKLSGKIELPPQNIISINVPLGGYVKSTQLLRGMNVKIGERLAMIEDPQFIELQQDYLTAKAEFTLNQSEYNRQTALNQSKAVSDKIYEQAKASFEIQHILLKSLEEKLRLIGLDPHKVTANNISRAVPIYSPINGFVSKVNINVGKYVTPGDVLLELIDPSDIHLSLTVFDKNVGKLTVGQKVFAYSNIHPEIKYEGEIAFISNSLSIDNATEVLCRLTQYDKMLLPGMFMNAEIELSGGKVPSVPEDAVQRFENKNYVFAAKENRTFEMQEVEIGATENGYIEIKNAEFLLSQNIVTKGAYTLLMTLKNNEEE